MKRNPSSSFSLFAWRQQQQQRKNEEDDNDVGPRRKKVFYFFCHFRYGMQATLILSFQLLF